MGLVNLTPFCAVPFLPVPVSSPCQSDSVSVSVSVPRPGTGRAMEAGTRRGAGAEGRDQLAGESQVCRRPAPLDPADHLRAAVARARCPIIQPPEECRAGATRRAEGQVPRRGVGPTARRDDRPVPGYGGGAVEPRPVHHLGHGGGPPGRCAGRPGLDVARRRPTGDG
jgi:hypothetical protein